MPGLPTSKPGTFDNPFPIALELVEHRLVLDSELLGGQIGADDDLTEQLLEANGTESLVVRVLDEAPMIPARWLAAEHFGW